MTAHTGDSVHITKKSHSRTLLHPMGHNFFAGCRDKLLPKWSWNQIAAGGGGLVPLFRNAGH